MTKKKSKIPEKMPEHIPAAPIPHLGDQVMLKTGRRHILLYNGPCPHDDSGAFGEFVYETHLIPFNAVSLAYECVMPAQERLTQLLEEAHSEELEDLCEDIADDDITDESIDL